MSSSHAKSANPAMPDSPENMTSANAANQADPGGKGDSGVTNSAAESPTGAAQVGGSPAGGCPVERGEGTRRLENRVDSEGRTAPRLPDALSPWRCDAYGDARDDVRAALSAGSDTADDLVALAIALAAVAEDPTDLDPETRQRALGSVARQLRAHAAVLTEAFDYLWSQRLQ